MAKRRNRRNETKRQAALQRTADTLTAAARQRPVAPIRSESEVFAPNPNGNRRKRLEARLAAGGVYTSPELRDGGGSEPDAAKARRISQANKT